LKRSIKTWTFVIGWRDLLPQRAGVKTWIDTGTSCVQLLNLCLDQAELPLDWALFTVYWLITYHQ